MNDHAFPLIFFCFILLCRNSIILLFVLGFFWTVGDKMDSLCAQNYESSKTSMICYSSSIVDAEKKGLN